ncbi:MAG: hypothetical protein ACTSUE_24880 [Promethearchaeota archaeon]
MQRKAIITEEYGDIDESSILFNPSNEFIMIILTHERGITIHRVPIGSELDEINDDTEWLHLRNPVDEEDYEYLVRQFTIWSGNEDDVINYVYLLEEILQCEEEGERHEKFCHLKDIMWGYDNFIEAGEPWLVMEEGFFEAFVQKVRATIGEHFTPGTDINVKRVRQAMGIGSRERSTIIFLGRALDALCDDGTLTFAGRNSPKRYKVN